MLQSKKKKTALQKYIQDKNTCGVLDWLYDVKIITACDFEGLLAETNKNIVSSGQR